MKLLSITIKILPVFMLTGWVLFFTSCGYGAGNQDAEKRFFTLRSVGGMEAVFAAKGGRLVSLKVPGWGGKQVSVVIGFDSLGAYDKATEPYFGATIGRYGNRIAKGRFSLDGKSYQLTVNNGPNTLHGGKTGFQYKLFQGEQQGDSCVVFSLTSPRGDNGFPGQLKVRVSYTLNAQNELRIDYRAETDQPTVVNLTNHAFFNLNGEGSGTILDHVLMIDADQFTPVDSTLIPTGAFALVKGSPFDFTYPKRIGARILDTAKNLQLTYGKGYDHNFVLKKDAGNAEGMHLAAKVAGDKSGVMMEILTTEPGLQFYSGNFMQGKNKLRSGPDDFRTAFCLETQHFPDSPNQPGFPSTVLRPGQKYQSSSIYRFSVVK